MSFHKFSVDDIPRPSQREGATPCRTQHPARPLAGCGVQTHLNLGPPQLFRRGCTLAWLWAVLKVLDVGLGIEFYGLDLMNFGLINIPADRCNSSMLKGDRML